MKRKLLTVPASVCALVCVFACAGCNDGGSVKKTEIDEQSGIIFVASDDVMKITDETTVEDYLNALKEKGELTFEGSKGQYGLYLESIDGKANEIISTSPYEGYSWMFYIDFMTLDGDGAIYAADDSTCIYGEKTLYKANFGVTYVPCVKGRTYAFVYEYYKY